MIDYSELEIWYSPEEIELALIEARVAVYFSQTRQDYFTEEPKDFYPHVWVISAICNALRYKPSSENAQN